MSNTGDKGNQQPPSHTQEGGEERTDAESRSLLFNSLNIVFNERWRNHFTNEECQFRINKLLDEYVSTLKEDKGDADYWRKRCEAAELFIKESPCDPDITSKQIVAHNHWQSLKQKEE